MPKKFEERTVCSTKAGRLLPPEFTLYHSRGLFVGKAEPGMTIRISTASGSTELSTVANADGDWSVELVQPPLWFTIFDIWTCDTEQNLCSEKIRYVCGGRQPKLADIYVGKKTACGFSDLGSEIAIFGSKGHLVGKTYVSAKTGAWFIRFAAPLKAGEQVCVVAKCPNGNMSPPRYNKAKSFSVDALYVDNIAGSGAVSGAAIELFDPVAGQLVRRVQASPSGQWSMSFTEPLAEGKRFEIRCAHSDGSIDRGPIITLFFHPCLPPFIDFFTGSVVAGTAESGLTVFFDQYRGDRHCGGGSVVANEKNRWTSSDDPQCSFETFEAGDVLVAATSEGVRQSATISCVVIDGQRPGLPTITTIDSDGASGRGEAGKYIVASTYADGLIERKLIADDNSWSVDWSTSVGSLTASTLIYFYVVGENSFNSVEPTSDYVARNATSDDGATVEIPVIAGYDGMAFTGTEATPDTEIRMYNENEENQFLSEEDAPVTAGEWRLVPDYYPAVGDTVSARAIGVGGTVNGVTSQLSLPFPIVVAPTNAVPIPPSIDAFLTRTIAGTSFVNTWVTVTVLPPGGTPKKYPAVQTTEKGVWQVDIGTAASDGTVISAVASFEEDGVQSDAYVKVINQHQSGIFEISEVTQASVSGTAPQAGQVIHGWRLSDGKQIVDYTVPTVPAPGTAFNAPYLDPLTLPVGDLLYAVSAFPGGGTMTNFDTKPEGYSKT